VTTDRDRVLSEFVDSWNAGRRPAVDDYVNRVPSADRAGLLEDITRYTTWAPDPAYSDDDLSDIRAEMSPVLEAYRQPAGLWPVLLPRWRRRASLSTADLAASLVSEAGLPPERAAKAEQYLERVEAGDLEPSGFSSRLLDVLSKVLRVSRERMESAGGSLRAAIPPAPAAAHFRADEEAAEGFRDDLELMADAMAAKSERQWDEVDELFRGGR
jgi:hypothetical protein